MNQQTRAVDLIARHKVARDLYLSILPTGAHVKLSALMDPKAPLYGSDFYRHLQDAFGWSIETASEQMDSAVTGYIEQCRALANLRRALRMVEDSGIDAKNAPLNEKIVRNAFATRYPYRRVYVTCTTRMMAPPWLKMTSNYAADVRVAPHYHLIVGAHDIALVDQCFVYRAATPIAHNEFPDVLVFPASYYRFSGDDAGHHNGFVLKVATLSTVDTDIRRGCRRLLMRARTTVTQRLGIVADDYEKKEPTK